LGKVFFRKGLRHVLIASLLIAVAKVNFAQVIITEIDPNGGFVEIYNPTDNIINLQPYVFGTLGKEFSFSSLILLPSKKYQVFNWECFDHNLTEFYIYKQGQFSEDGFVDYVRVGGDPLNSQILFASTAGVWDGRTAFTPVIPVDNPITNLDYLTLTNLNLGAKSGFDTNSSTWGFAKNSLGSSPLCTDQSFQGPVKLLTTNENGEFYDYEADVPIHSDQYLHSNSVVDYDSSEEIILTAGFEVAQGALFIAFIDGCGFGDNGNLN